MPQTQQTNNQERINMTLHIDETPWTLNPAYRI